MTDEPMLTVTYEVPLSECKWAAEEVAKGGFRSKGTTYEAKAAAYRKWEAENQRYKVLAIEDWRYVQDDEGRTVASFTGTHPNPEAAARAEAERLNRKNS